MPHSPVKFSPHFRGMSSVSCYFLVCFSETLAYYHQTTQCYIPQHLLLSHNNKLLLLGSHHVVSVNWMAGTASGTTPFSATSAKPQQNSQSTNTSTRAGSTMRRPSPLLLLCLRTFFSNFHFYSFLHFSEILRFSQQWWFYTVSHYTHWTWRQQVHLKPTRIHGVIPP